MAKEKKVTEQQNNSQKSNNSQNNTPKKKPLTEAEKRKIQLKNTADENQKVLLADINNIDISDKDGQTKLRVLLRTLKTLDRTEYAGQVQNVIADNNISYEFIQQLEIVSGVLDAFKRKEEYLLRNLNGTNIVEQYDQIDIIKKYSREAFIKYFAALDHITIANDAMLELDFGNRWDVEECKKNSKNDLDKPKYTYVALSEDEVKMIDEIRLTAISLVS